MLNKRTLPLTTLAARLLGLFLILLTSALHGVELQPFEWHYDVVYQQKNRAYNGRGAYKLEMDAKGDWYFSLSVQTHNRIFSSIEKVRLRPDADNVVVPLEKKRRTVVLGIPTNKKIELDLANEHPYDALTVVLRLLYDLQIPPEEHSKWRLWLAEEGRYRNFILHKEERIRIANRLIDCYVIKMQEGKQDNSLVIWVAKQENYIVKMTRTRSNVKIIMETVSVLNGNDEESI